MAKVIMVGIVLLHCLLHGVPSEATHSSKKLLGVHIRISALHEPPMIYIEKQPSSNTTRVYGIKKQYVDLLQEILGFTYTFVEVPISAVKDGPGIEATTIEYFTKGEFDVISRGQFLSIRNFAYMDFTYPTLVGQVSLVQPMPKLENRLFAPVKPFRLEVWICIVIAFFFTTLAMSCTSLRPSKAKYSKQKQFDERPKGIRNSGLYVLNVFLSQGAYLPNQRFSARLLAGSWCLAGFVITYAYTSTLVSYLSIPKYEPIVHSLEDLAESKTLQFVVGRDTPIVDFLMKSTSGYGKVLGDKLRRNPKNMVIPLMDDIYKLLDTRCCAYLEGELFINMLIYRSMESHKGECRLTTGHPLPFDVLLSMGVVKHYPHRSDLDVGILRLWENGIWLRMLKQLNKRVDKCLAKQEDRARDSRLNLYDLTSGFIILGLGLSFSILTFISEITVYYVDRYRDKLIIL